MSTARVTSRWQRIRRLWVRAGIAIWIAMPMAMFLVFRAQGLPADTWQTTPSVRVDRDDRWTAFQTPNRGPIQTNAVIIPGCPVQSDAYAPLARSLAEAGLPALVMQVPYWCAPWPTHEADLDRRIVEAAMVNCPSCRWIVIGHSRGVSHALRVAARNPRRFAGLVLIGSTHPRAVDYSRLAMPVLKIHGDKDGVAPLDVARANGRLLPPATEWVTIEGANHSQFAYYGPYQLFDGRATITREEQHLRTVRAILDFVGLRSR